MMHSVTVVQKAKKKAKGEYSFFTSESQSLLTGFVHIPQAQSFISIYPFYLNAKKLFSTTKYPSFIHIGQEQKIPFRSDF